MKAATYARFSTDKQRPESIADQERECDRIAEREGFTIIARYSDASISGGTSKRPGYQRMLAAARRREFSAIVAEDQSRLWRNPAEQEPRLAELDDLGIVVVAADIDTREESADVIGAVKGAMNSAFRREIGRRTRRGLEGLAIAGLCTGGKAYGYRNVKREVEGRDKPITEQVIDPKQAQIVLRIFTAYANGKSPRQIASDLNTAGIPAPGASWKRVARRKDAKWLFTAVRTLLRNEKYVGRVVWGRTKWKRLKSDSSRRVVVPATVPPVVHVREDLRIVSDQLWDAVQARIKESTHIGGKRPAAAQSFKHPLSGLLRCGLCDASYVIASSYDYACSSYRNGGPAACPNTLRVPRALVEQTMFDALGEAVTQPAWLEKFSRWFRAQLEAGQKAEASNGAADAKRRAAVDREIGNLVDAITRGGLGGSRTLADRLRALEDEQARLAHVKPARVTVTPFLSLARLKTMFGLLVEELPALAKADPARARNVLRQLVGSHIRIVEEDGVPHLVFEVTGTRMALASGLPSPGERVGSGGRI